MTRFAPEALSLANGLAALTLEQLAAVGARLGLNDGLTSKARLLAEIPARLADRAAVRRLVRELAPAEARQLHQSAACETLTPMLGAGVAFRFGVTAAPEALLARGLLLPDVATGLHRPPAEVLAVVSDEAAKKIAARGAAATPAAPVALDAASAFRDAVTIWCFVLKNPIALTHSGAAPKRALAKLAPLLEVADDHEPLAAILARFGSSRLELLVNDAERRGALERREGELFATDWLGGRLAARERYFAAELGAAAVGEDQTGGALLAAYVLGLAPRGRWLALADVAAAAQELGGAADEELRAALLALFVGGYLAAGVGDGGALCVQRQADFDAPAPPPPAEGEPEFLVGGNFELKVAYDLPLATRLRLEAFADQAAGGRFLSYAITKASVYRALDAGVAVDEVVAFLGRHATRPIPQNVEFSLRDWAAQYGALSFSDRLLLAAETAALADEVATLPALAPLVKKRLELHAVEIAPGDYDAARRALLAAGYLPRSLRSGPGLAVSPRLLFHGGGPEEAAPRAAPLSAAAMTAAILDFAVANRRRIKLWRKDEPEPEQVTPRRVVTYKGEKHLRAEGPNGGTLIPLAAIDRAVLA